MKLTHDRDKTVLHPRGRNSSRLANAALLRVHAVSQLVGLHKLTRGNNDMLLLTTNGCIFMLKFFIKFPFFKMPFKRLQHSCPEHDVLNTEVYLVQLQRMRLWRLNTHQNMISHFSLVLTSVLSRSLTETLHSLHVTRRNRFKAFQTNNRAPKKSKSTKRITRQRLPVDPRCPGNKSKMSLTTASRSR